MNCVARPTFSILTPLSPMHQSIFLAYNKYVRSRTATMVNLRGHEHVTAAHCSPSDEQRKRRDPTDAQAAPQLRTQLRKTAARCPIFDAGARCRCGGGDPRDRGAPATAMRAATPLGATRAAAVCRCLARLMQYKFRAVCRNGHPSPRSRSRGREAASGRRRRDLSAAGAVGPQLAHLASAVCDKTKKVCRSVCRERDGTARDSGILVTALLGLRR